MDASTAGSTKKQRDRAKQRQKRKEKQEKALHPPRIQAQMRRSLQTHPTDLMLTTHGSIIDVIAKEEPAFRGALRVFVAGDPQRAQPIDITDLGVEKLVKACPGLTTVTLHGTRNLGRTAFPTVLRNCANIEAVTISVVTGQTSKRTQLNSTLDWLMDKDWVKKLRYLEFRGVHISPDHHNFPDFLTKRRPALEIVFEYDGPAVLIRDMEGVPLSRVPAQGTTSSKGKGKGKGKPKKKDLEDEDDWEDDDDDDFGFDVSSDPKANARMLSRLGEQMAMNDALGRDLYEFEMDDDYGGYDDMLDSDEEIDPSEMKKMLKITRQMGGGGY